MRLMSDKASEDFVELSLDTRVNARWSLAIPVEPADAGSSSPNDRSQTPRSRT